MEVNCTYKMDRKPKLNLYVAPPYCRIGEQDQEKKCTRIEASDPFKLLLLCESLTDTSTPSMEKKINKYVTHEAEADTSFIISLLPSSEEAVVQVKGKQILLPEIRMHVPVDVIRGIIKHRHTAVPEFTALDDTIQEVIIKVTGHKNHSKVLTIPVITRKNRDKTCLHTIPLLISVVNPRKEEVFVARLVHETFRFCSTVLLNTYTAEEERRVKRQCQSLLAVARKLFSSLDDLSGLLKEIMSEAKRLTNAERCSLFLLDPDHMYLVAKVFDGIATKEVQAEVRITKDQGIAGHVAATGKILNIKDAYTHPLFFKGIDEATGFKTRNLLCFPIRDGKDIIGVAQLCNKLEGIFDNFDEEIALAVSIYCGLSIMHSLAYEKIQAAQARCMLSNELMMYHMKVHASDVVNVILCEEAHDPPKYNEFSFSPREIPPEETACYILKMFESLGLLSLFKIKPETLVRFVLYVRRGYRNQPYHNWMHAFAVTHFGYLCVKNFKLIEEKYITELECLAFMVSCMAHDIDHRGTTNAYQLASGSVLASLYSSEGSVMELHHLSQTLCILNTEDCNFLEGLQTDQYTLCLDLIKDMILATDLASHLKYVGKQLELAQNGFNKHNPEHRYLTICLLMTSADLSDQTKDWSITKTIAQQLYEEFFSQGDMEKRMGNQPVDMMDRDKASIPDLQIEFLDKICFPLYTILAAIFPLANEMVGAIIQNIKYWEVSKTVFERYCAEGSTSMEVLLGENFESEVITAFEDNGDAK